MSSDWVAAQNDMLQWLIDAAEGEERTVRALVLRMLTVNMAAIHTSSIVRRFLQPDRSLNHLRFCQSFTQAILLLAAHPQYIQPLREEVESIVREEGWTKAAMNKMRRIDSFMKETARFLGLGASASLLLSS